jgi:hypothetical protein
MKDFTDFAKLLKKMFTQFLIYKDFKIINFNKLYLLNVNKIKKIF